MGDLFKIQSAQNKQPPLHGIPQNAPLITSNVESTHFFFPPLSLPVVQSSPTISFMRCCFNQQQQHQRIIREIYRAPLGVEWNGFFQFCNNTNEELRHHRDLQPRPCQEVSQFGCLLISSFLFFLQFLTRNGNLVYFIIILSFG